MNLEIECPHCRRAISAPADTEVTCHLCGGGLIAKSPGFKTPAKPAKSKNHGSPILLAFLLILLLLGIHAATTEEFTFDAGLICQVVSMGLVAVAYLIPSTIVALRDTSHQKLIFLLNLFTGWTVIGWIVALVWSIVDKPRTA